MAPTAGPVTAAHMESALAERTAGTQPTTTAAKAMARVVERKEPIDTVEISSDLLGDPRRLRAAGPGVPLFKIAESPFPDSTGKTRDSEGLPSGQSPLVDAFG